MDKGIINKLKQQDKKTQEYFYKTHAKRMFLICYRYLDNEAEASEIMNDGFYKVFSHIDKFKNGGFSGLMSWTRKIMINECLQHIRKRKDIQFVDVDEIKLGHSEEMPDTDLEAETYYKFIRELPVKHRTVFNLYVVEGYSHKEIEDKLDIPANTSRSYLLRARLELKEKIQNLNNYENQ